MYTIGNSCKRLMILVNHQPFAFIKSRTTDILRYQSTQKSIPATAENIDIGIIVSD